MSGGATRGDGDRLLPHQLPRPPHLAEAARETLPPISSHPEPGVGRDPHCCRHLLPIKGN